jgi:hypothetical protein
VLFVNSSNQLAQNNASFFWNAGTTSLGIGTTAPGGKLGILSTTEQLRLSYDATYYAKFTTANDSKLSIETSTSTQSMLTIGKGTAQNAGVSFDGNTNDYYLGMDDATDKLMIGLGLAISTTPRITMDAIGNIGIGTTNPLYNLDVVGDLRITGTPYRNGGDIAWQTPSDLSLKNIIGVADKGIDELMRLNEISGKCFWTGI